MSSCQDQKKEEKIRIKKSRKYLGIPHGAFTVKHIRELALEKIMKEHSQFTEVDKNVLRAVIEGESLNADTVCCDMMMRPCVMGCVSFLKSTKEII